MLPLSRLEELQSDASADDLQIDFAMQYWSEEQAAAYFEWGVPKCQMKVSHRLPGDPPMR